MEDCGVSGGDIRTAVGSRTALYVELLTRPKLVEVEEVTNKKTARIWIYSIEEPVRWLNATDVFERTRYEERMRLQFENILNVDPKYTTFEIDIKLKAFIGKVLDSLHNLTTDAFLNPVNADIRVQVLISQMRHLEVLAPGLREIILNILSERGYVIPEERRGRWKPKEKVIEQPPVDKIDIGYLDEAPAPNGYIIVYSDSSEIKEKLRKGEFGKLPLRVELPHNAPENSAELLQGIFQDMHITGLRIDAGESLLPIGSEASGKVLNIRGVQDEATFRQLKQGLEFFHAAFLNKATERSEQLELDF
ncbi:TPA: hypothetical protein HA238_03290 [Candidatus Micrarchaeota archaeon]|nr:hypothetical protein [Candidatus Micrarchaeota archaeon]